MKIFVAILVNALFSFFGFVLFLCLMPQGQSSGGWIGGGNMFGSFRDIIKLYAFFSVLACVPVGLVNGLILGGIINNLLVAVLLAFVLSLLFAPLFGNTPMTTKDLSDITIFFVICSACNIATGYLLKWKFPDSLGNP
jgi:hypothetical protein